VVMNDRLPPTSPFPDRAGKVTYGATAADRRREQASDKAHEESAIRIDELAAGGDYDGVNTWRQIYAAVVQLANNTPPRPLHLSERTRNDRWRPLPLPTNLA
jgi:hypothetical protein